MNKCIILSAPDNLLVLVCLRFHSHILEFLRKPHFIVSIYMITKIINLNVLKPSCYENISYVKLGDNHHAELPPGMFEWIGVWGEGGEGAQVKKVQEFYILVFKMSYFNWNDREIRNI